MICSARDDGRLASLFKRNCAADFRQRVQSDKENQLDVGSPNQASMEPAWLLTVMLSRFMFITLK